MKSTLKKKEKISDLVTYLDSLNCISYTIGIKGHHEKIVYHKDKQANPNSLNSRVRVHR
jgi:hypothetical protein